jgi:hypothetical protein
MQTECHGQIVQDERLGSVNLWPNSDVCLTETAIGTFADEVCGATHNEPAAAGQRDRSASGVAFYATGFVSGGWALIHLTASFSEVNYPTKCTGPISSHAKCRPLAPLAIAEP